MQYCEHFKMPFKHFSVINKIVAQIYEFNSALDAL